VPKRRIEHARIAGISDHVRNAGLFVLEKRSHPGLAAVGGFVNAAFRFVGRDTQDGMSERAHDDNVRIAWIDDHGRNVMRIVEADVRPREACVGGFVHPVAFGLLAGADVNDVGIRRRDCHRPNRGYALAIEDGSPHGAAIGGFPSTAAGRAHVIDGCVAGNACDGGNAAAAVRSDHPPAHG